MKNRIAKNGESFQPLTVEIILETEKDARVFCRLTESNISLLTLANRHIGPNEEEISLALINDMFNNLVYKKVHRVSGLKT